MESEGIKFRKEFGQNFLIDKSVPESIADNCADKEDCMVLEIGPGIGCLTAELAKRYKKVVAVEIDKGLIPVLAKTLAEYDNVTVINNDVMKLDLAALVEEYSEGMEVCVCANLPYYITTPILMRLLESGVRFSSITIMIQAEVASRLTAKAGSDDYGAITAVLAYYGEAEKLFSVPAHCFMPAPKVNSAVIRINLYKEKKYSPKNEKLFFGVIKAAFEQRRKTLTNAIHSKYPDYSKEDIQSLLVSLGYTPTVRGETLSTEEFLHLSDALWDLKRN
jgi:16S rRNA (adenine1518-N6/adenine1519-N6)-dimethyltransferase